MTILSLFPPELRKILCEIEALGFSLCLVGGATRDYFLFGKLSNDLDFELRNEEIWKLRDFLKNKNIIYKELPYQIFRLNWRGFDLEFSSPRLEEPVTNNKTHHHFKATLNPKLSYREAFLRRDFTINAIGLELLLQAENDKINGEEDRGNEKIIDLFGGLVDLSNRLLKNVSDSFFLDSVRFLRLIRFFIKYDFKIEETLKNRIGEFQLSELSVHHFKAEMTKSGCPGAFIKQFNDWVESYKLTPPQTYQDLLSLKFNGNEKNIEELLLSSFLQSYEDAEKLTSFLSMPKKELKDLRKFFQNFEEFKKNPPNVFHQLAGKEKREILKNPLLKLLKNLDETRDWGLRLEGRGIEDLSFLNHLLDFDGIEVDECELNATPKDERSLLKYFLKIKKL